MASRKLLEIKVKAYEGILGIHPSSSTSECDPHLPPIPPKHSADTAAHIHELESLLQEEKMRRFAAESQVAAMRKSTALMSAEMEQVRQHYRA